MILRNEKGEEEVVKGQRNIMKKVKAEQEEEETEDRKEVKGQMEAKEVR